MENTALLLFLTFIFVFLLVNSINGALWRERAIKEGEFDFLPAFVWALTSVSGVGLVLVIGKSFPSNETGINDNLGFALGLTGLIVTLVTGLTIAAAWRAIDDAKKAEKIVETAVEKLNVIYSDVETKSVSIAIGFIQTRLFDNPTNSERSVINMLLVALNSANSQDKVSILSAITLDSDAFNTFEKKFANVKDIQKWFRTLLNDETLKPGEKAVIHKLLSKCV